MLERLDACPLCGSRAAEQLDVQNLNSREPGRARRLATEIGSDFFIHQRISVCHGCHHLFQSVRPTSDALDLLYGKFANALSKVTPSESNMFEYLLRHNSKDYVQLVDRSLTLLDEQGLVNGAQSALEVRTYGGAMAALLGERGIPYVEAAYLQDFDALLAARVFGIENLVPFSFARPLPDFETLRERYDLIIMYEALTHSREPRSVLDFLDARLSKGGRAVLFREPDNPRLRRYFPLKVVFNNFHLNLFNSDTVHSLFESDGRFIVKVCPERHPSLPVPVYFTVIVERRAASSTSEGPSSQSASHWGPEFYRSWLRRDKHERLTEVLGPAQRRWDWLMRRVRDATSSRLSG